jgi:hypothetical protein
MAGSVANGSELVPRPWGTNGLSRLVDRAYGAQGIANWHKHQASWEARYAATAEVVMEFLRSSAHVLNSYHNGRALRRPIYRRESDQS